MPELPEVETICRQLALRVISHRIKDVRVLDRRVIKGTSGDELVRRLKGKTVRSVHRRGKLIILTLSSGDYLVFHLRISGWIAQDDHLARHARFSLSLENAAAIQFCDSRVLGEVRLVRQINELPLMRRMGPEPLEISLQQFIERFQGKTGKIKPLLMDQSFLAGIGNIYAQEALFCAGIHPERPVYRLHRDELKKLRRCLRSILIRAIEKRGTTARTYRQTNGSGGEYIRYLCVYQRQGQPCRRCRRKIVRTIVSGRGTCFCRQCQK